MSRANLENVRGLFPDDAEHPQAPLWPSERLPLAALDLGVDAPTSWANRRSGSRNDAQRLDADTGRYRPLSANQKEVNTAHARQRGPGGRAIAEIKNW